MLLSRALYICISPEKNRDAAGVPAKAVRRICSALKVVHRPQTERLGQLVQRGVRLAHQLRIGDVGERESIAVATLDDARQLLLELLVERHAGQHVVEL